METPRFVFIIIIIIYIYYYYINRAKSHIFLQTFDECIEAGQPDCDPDNMWLQIPFLCGHDPACW